MKRVELQTCEMGRVAEKNQASLMERNVGESGIGGKVVLRLMSVGELEMCTQNGRMSCDGFDNSYPCHQ